MFATDAIEDSVLNKALSCFVSLCLQDRYKRKVSEREFQRI